MPLQHHDLEKKVNINRSNSLAKNKYAEKKFQGKKDEEKTYNNEKPIKPKRSPLLSVSTLIRKQKSVDEGMSQKLKDSRRISVSWSSVDDKIEITSDIESIKSDHHYSELPYFCASQSVPQSNTLPHNHHASYHQRSTQDMIYSQSITSSSGYGSSYSGYNSSQYTPHDTLTTNINSSLHTFDSDKYKKCVFAPPHPPMPPPRFSLDSSYSGGKGKRKGKGKQRAQKFVLYSDAESDQVKQYLAALPEDKRPVNTLGVQWRIKQLQTQLPRYDHNINYCHEMSPEEQEELFLFVENRKERAQGQGQVKTFKKKEKKKCDKCGGLIECGIIADKVPGKVYHPGCFTCGTCNEILVDLIYFQLNGELHCGRHHAELLRPRCHACDELIFGFEFITADGHEYHKEHFCCWECDSSLGGTKYVSHKGQPYCQICYEKLFCTRCVSCKEPIGVGVPVYKHGPLRWHGNPTCYSCSFCKRSLVNRTFMPTERFVYCSKNCFRCHESLRKTKGK